jgi:hypothetical protein
MFAAPTLPAIDPRTFVRYFGGEGAKYINDGTIVNNGYESAGYITKLLNEFLLNSVFAVYTITR